MLYKIEKRQDSDVLKPSTKDPSHMVKIKMTLVYEGSFTILYTQSLYFVYIEIYIYIVYIFSTYLVYI